MTILQVAIIGIIIVLFYIIDKIQKIYRETKEVNERLKRGGMETLNEKLIKINEQKNVSENTKNSEGMIEILKDL
jgi:hypothetical protein